MTKWKGLKWVGAAAGFGLGFAYSHFIGCHAGWAMSRNPWVTGTIFAVMGFSLAELAAGDNKPPPGAEDKKMEDGM
jgi:hypothetical protein